MCDKLKRSSTGGAWASSKTGSSRTIHERGVVTNVETDGCQPAHDIACSRVRCTLTERESHTAEAGDSGVVSSRAQGVRTTVSNAFNRPDQLSADLRERVLATAKRLGYAGPDPVARSLRTRKAGAVGLVMAEPLTYFFSDPAARDFVAGVAQSCEELGQGLQLVSVGSSRSLADGTAAVLGAGVDGFVVYSVGDDDPYLQVVLQRRLPVVVVDQPKDLSGVSRVGIDDRAAMRELAGYVLGLGHRELGLLTMRLGRDRRQDLVDAERLRSPTFDVQRERIVGVWEAMTAAGVDPDSLTVVESYEHLPTSGGTAAKVALQANPRLTALMCTADILALSAMDYLRAHGIYVPGQMTVTGFDGVPEALSRG